MFSNLQKTLVRVVVTLILLVAVMGFAAGIQAPTAHAQGAPQEPISCFTKEIGRSGQQNFFNGEGYWSVSLYAAYSTYDGSYCGYMWGQTHLHENPGAVWGTLSAVITDCNWNYINWATGSTRVTGGGASGWDYWATTSRVYQGCGGAIGFFSVNNVVHDIITGIHWA